MASAWLETLKSAQKTALVQDNRRKIHYTFNDGKEMSEEYDIRTNDLLVRKWCCKSTLGGSGKWTFEIGEQLTITNNLETDGMVENVMSPVLVRKDTKKAIQWRIRNLPYPLETYDVSVYNEEEKIVVRTSNKKYYKKIDVPDLRRLNVSLENDQLSIAHANNTLIITYQKPRQMLEFESAILEELKKLKTTRDGDVDCKQS